MKMGMTIKEGSEEEMRKEYEALLEKAKVGFGDELEIINDIDGTFIIRKEDIKISFSLSKYLAGKYAIYQIME